MDYKKQEAAGAGGEGAAGLQPPPPSYNEASSTNYNTSFSSITETGTSNPSYQPPPSGSQPYGNNFQQVPPYGSPQQLPPGTAYYASPHHHQHPGVVVVTQPGMVNTISRPVPDHFGLAIFVTLCCCWPLGVVALLRARESREAVARGDVDSALRLANESKRMSIIGIICGVFFSIFGGVGIIIALSS